VYATNFISCHTEIAVVVSRKFVDELQDEVPGLVKDKVITKTQGDAILKRYKDVEESHNLVSIIATFGAILIGLGILTLVALNWEQIPDLLRVLILFVITFGAYWAGYELRFKRSFPKVGSSLIFLGAILFGVSIILISQIYNLSSDNVHWMLLWFIGIIVVAYLLESTSVLMLSLLIFSYWFGTQFAYLAGGKAGLESLFEFWPFTMVVFLCYGILLWAIGELHKEKRPSYAFPYKVLGVLFIIFNTYMLTFKWFTNDFWFRNEFANIPAATFVLLWVLAIVSIALLIYATRDWKLWVPLAVLAVIAILAITFPGTRTEGYYGGGPLFTPYSLLFNAAFIALLIGVAAYGMQTKQAYLVNLAVLFFAVDVFTRYFEFFFDRLSGGVFFIVTGVILILAAVALEKLRRKLITEM
jgi:uncharacterized membrane protein